MFQPSKAFIEESERIANQYGVPTRVVIDEQGLHIIVGEDLTRVKIEDKTKQLEYGEKQNTRNME